MRQASGQYKGLQWQVSSYSVATGPNSDAPTGGGGNPAYRAPMPQYSGVVWLNSDFGGGYGQVCSGALLPDRRSILTAAHCVTDFSLATPLSTTVHFYGGSADINIRTDPAATLVTGNQYFVHPGYVGWSVVDDNDIAIVRLANDAPSFAASYGLYGGELTGSEFTLAGYGARSTVGGSLGFDAQSGYLRLGENRYDFRLGDSDFGDAFAEMLGVSSDLVDFSYLSDFDSGFAENDASCLFIGGMFGLSGPKYCDLGVGLMEASTSFNDSGSPQFINGLIASITSYGGTFAPDFGDVDYEDNSSFGEFNGFVPVFTHLDFIRSSMVPEPGSLALVGLGLLGIGFARRHRSTST
jgi:hypothetical protein